MKKKLFALAAGVLVFCGLGAIVHLDPDAVQTTAAAGCLLGAVFGVITSEVRL
jgi:hypothetical protein